MTQPSQLDYRVELDCYCGPLDLLLYLVKRDEIDLHDIPIARLTDQYMQHLALIQEIDIDLAGEFLVMAATLLEIKSAMLVPAGQAAEDDPNAQQQADPALDPRYELVQQLLAYKRFKDFANELEDRYDTWHQRFAHAPARAEAPTAADPDDESAGVVEIDLEDVSVLDLCEAFARILESVGQGPARHEVVYDDTPISLHAEDILDRLGREQSRSLTLQEVFVGRRTRAEMIGLFLATLELTRQRKVKVTQDKTTGLIRIELRPEQEQVEPETPDWKDPVTGEVQYEWPSEEARLRAERRAQLRVARAKGQVVEDDDVHNEAEEAEGTDDEADEPAV